MARPPITNIIDQLPHANRHLERQRSVAAITHLTVHYDAVNRPPGPYDPIARYRAQADYHINGRDWNPAPNVYVPGFGLMYHYRISADGRIWQTQPETLITWHVNNANPFALGVCLDCGANQGPTPAQLASLSAFTNWIVIDRTDLRVDFSTVMGHLEFRAWGASTQCPGQILPYVQRYRAGTWGRPDGNPAPVPMPDPAPERRPEVELFPTGKTVAGGFLDLYRKYGLFVTGYPLTFEQHEAGLTVQYFENTRMEWRPGTQPRFGGVGRQYLDLLALAAQRDPGIPTPAVAAVAATDAPGEAL